MSTYTLGKVKMIARGEWSETEHYAPLDIVSYEESSYLARAASLGILPTNEAYWMLLAKKGEKGDPGEDGISPTVEVTDIPGGHRIRFTDSEHPDGIVFDVPDGVDGVSPAVSVSEISGGHRFTVTDKDHPTGISFDVLDGVDGDDGFSPEITISVISGGHRFTVTDKDHPDGVSFDVLDGVTQDISGKADKTTTVNGKPLSENVLLDAGDIPVLNGETETVGEMLSQLSAEKVNSTDTITNAQIDALFN